MAAVTAAERLQWEEEGWFVREGAIPVEAIDEATAQLSRRILEVADEYLAHRRSEFDFFKLMPSSLERFEAFWDLSDGGPAGRPREEWERFVMRVGHSLHQHDPVFARLCRAPAAVDALRELLPAPVAFVTTAVIYKQPSSSAVFFRPHQDAWYLPASPPEHLALAFVALDDCDAANGCLEIAPGTHKAGLQMKLEMGERDFIAHGTPDPRLAALPTIKLEVPRGSLAIVNGLTYHSSASNRSPGPRRALISHVLSGAAKMDPLSWAQPPPDGFIPIDS